MLIPTLIMGVLALVLLYAAPHRQRPGKARELGTPYAPATPPVPLPARQLPWHVIRLYLITFRKGA